MIVFHLHIPRTGGTAVLHTVQNGFGKDRFVKFKSVPQVEKDPNMRKETVAVGGHFYWGLHELFNRDHLYFVVLRDPVERVGSLYDYVVAREGHQNQALWSRTSLHQVLAEKLTPQEISNWQVRQLAGNDYRKGPVTASVMEKAWEHLSQDNVIVTFTDMLNDGLLQLGAQTGIHVRQLRRKHNAARRSSHSEDTIRLIREANAFDIELYNRARAEFINRLQKPARLPLITPLQAYQERVAAFRAKEEALDALLLHRAELSQYRTEQRQTKGVARKPEPEPEESKSANKVKQLFPTSFRLAIKRLVDKTT